MSLRLWRIGWSGYTVWSGEGARRYGGRWNPPDTAVIYCGTSYAIAALEILAHANIGRMPAPMRYISAHLPDDASIETLDESTLPGWDAPDMAVSQAFGAAWLRACRSLVLLVPSVVTRGLDRNAVVNPLHPQAARIAVSPEKPAYWDARLAPSAPLPGASP